MQHLSASTIDEHQLGHCLQVYPAVVQRAYAQRIKADKKRAEAVERDGWRYETLPQEVGHDRDDGGEGMTLEQLERLVQWKITHGASRPFLPAMIRKNGASSVSEATSEAAKTLSTLKATSSVSQALEVTMAAMATVSKLSGVGPATASLLLAVFDPQLVPFFQDELWAWCFPEKNAGLGSGSGSTKLKYDRKEYEMLFRKCWEVKDRLGVRFPGMVALEKGSFVLQHMELLDEQESALLVGDEKRADDQVGPRKEPKKTSVKSPTRETARTKTKRTASATEKTSKVEDEADSGQRRSKRVRK